MNRINKLAFNKILDFAIRNYEKKYSCFCVNVMMILKCTTWYMAYIALSVVLGRAMHAVRNVCY